MTPCQNRFSVACNNTLEFHGLSVVFVHILGKIAVKHGIIGILGYLSSVVSGVMFGAKADAGGWDSVFPIAIAFGIVGAIVIGLMWNAPATGYEKLNKVVKELENEE